MTTRRLRFSLLNALAIVILLALGTSIAPAATADATPKLGADETASGSLYLRRSAQSEPFAALRVSTHYTVSVTGTLARVQVEQRFSNPTDEWLQGLYTFPLSTRAAVDELKMVVGDRTILGQIRPKEEARAKYETARAEGKHASLVDQQRPNLFRTSVANIAPRSSIEVQIAYLETIEYRDARYTLTLPLSITPRYTPGGNEPTSELVTAATQTAAIEVSLKPGFRLDHVRSLYHAVNFTTAGGGRIVQLRESIVPANRDFALEWAPVVATEPAAAVFVERHGDEGYALLTLTPPDIAGEYARPREVIFVIDTSGSMTGPSIEQARAALQLGVDRLSSKDRFNIIRFSSEATRLFAGPVGVNDDSLARARAYIQRLSADGGTEMRAALNLVFDTGPPEDALRQIVFITDGSVSNEAELVRLIHDELGSARLFTVGIGAAPNDYFLREAAAAGRGSFTFIADVNDVRDRMDDLFRKLERPALVDLQLTWPNGQPVEAAAPIPADLYAGDPLSIVTRIPKVPTGLLSINGMLGSSPWSRQIMLTDVDERAGVAKLWARERISDLSRQQHLDGNREELATAIRDLAMAHHLVSEQTSLVAVDETPARARKTPYGTQRAPVAAPVGGARAQTAGMPVTATPAALLTIIATLLIGLALIALLI